MSKILFIYIPFIIIVALNFYLLKSIRESKNNPENKNNQEEEIDAIDWIAENEDRFNDYEFTSKKEEQEGLFRIDEVIFEELTTPIFYNNFLSHNVPVLIRNGSKILPAYSSFKNETFLKEKIGNFKINVEKKPINDKNFAYFTKNFSREQMTYNEFLDNYLNFENNKEQKYNYYWAEENVPEILHDQLVIPNFSKFMNLERVNIWQVKFKKKLNK